MSSSDQIENYVNRFNNRKICNRFLGVFSSDNLPDYFVKGCGLICNYDPLNKEGSHWCAILWPINLEKIIWFDSFGLPPDYDDRILHDRTAFKAYIEKIAQKNNIVTSFNTFDFQSLTTSVCGHYATFFILYGLDNMEQFKSIRQPMRDKIIREAINFPSD